MDSVLQIDHLREKIFNTLSFQDLISLDQVSQAVQQRVRTYRYPHEFFIYLEQDFSWTGPSGQWCQMALINKDDCYVLPASHLAFVGSSPAAAAATALEPGQGLGPAEFSLFQRGPLLNTVSIQLYLYFSKNIAFDALYVICLLEMLSDQVESLEISVDLYLRLGQDWDQDFIDQMSQKITVKNFFAHFDSCHKLKLRIDNGISKYWNPHFKTFLDLIQLDGKFLSRFPHLQQLTLYGSNISSLAQLPNPHLLEKLKLCPKTYNQSNDFSSVIILDSESDSESDSGPQVLNFLSLKQLKIASGSEIGPYSVWECLTEYKNRRGDVWQQIFNHFCGFDLLASLITFPPVGLDRLTLDLSAISYRWAAEILQTLTSSSSLSTVELCFLEADETVKRFDNKAGIGGNFLECLLKNFPDWSMSGSSGGLKNLIFNDCEFNQVLDFLTLFSFDQLENLTIDYKRPGDGSCGCPCCGSVCGSDYWSPQQEADEQEFQSKVKDFVESDKFKHFKNLTIR